jgi:hypothetical protein
VEEIVESIKKFPYEVRFEQAEARRVVCLRDKLETNSHHYRVTIAYEVVGVERVAPDRDVAFVLRAGLSFVHEEGPDSFTKFRGRLEASLRLEGRSEASERSPEVIITNEPISVRVYVDQPVRLAVYKTLARLGREGMSKAHVPTRLMPVLKRLVQKPAKVKSSKSKPVSVARKAFTAAYADAIKEGKTKDEACAIGIRAARLMTEVSK